MPDVQGLDIDPQDLVAVREILGRFVPDRQVWAFGSRVNGRARKFSDLDLVVIGDEPMDWRLQSRLKNAFVDSDLPWRVDVVDWASTRPSFQDLIKRRYVVLQEP